MGLSHTAKKEIKVVKCLAVGVDVKWEAGVGREEGWGVIVISFIHEDILHHIHTMHVINVNKSDGLISYIVLPTSALELL